MGTRLLSAIWKWMTHCPQCNEIPCACPRAWDEPDAHLSSYDRWRNNWHWGDDHS